MTSSGFARALGLAVACAFASGCGQEPAGPAEEPTISLLIVSGDLQSGPAGGELPNALVIKATNANGNPLDGIAVNFRVTSGGGSVFAGASVTNANGKAQDYWTLGTSTAQPQTLEVRAVTPNGVKHVFGVFTANALPTAATRVVLQAGDGQLAPHGTSVPIAPAVLVTDQYGNPVPGHSVSFAVGAGGGSTTGAAATTDASGVAAIGSWTLGNAMCPNSLTATAAGGLSGSPVTFTATARDCWTALPAMAARQNLGSGAVNGIVYAAGGYSAIVGAPVATFEAFNPATNSWSARVAMPTQRYSLAVGVSGGTLYAVGGSAINGGPPVDVVEAYDPIGNVWATKAVMPTARRGLGIGVINGVLYAVGGENGSGVLGTLEAYDPATNTWVARTAMPTPRSYAGVGVVNGILYAVGGYTSGGGFLATVEAYDPVTDTWTARTPLPTARAAAAVSGANGILYAIGGDTGANFMLAQVQAYDPLTNAWTAKTPMPGGQRGFATATMANGLIYVVGGNTGFGIVGRAESYVP